MKPAPFDYACPDTLEEAIEMLGSGDAKVLAGGQSLVPLLNLRLARPALLVDINRVAGLDHMQVADGSFHIGSLVRHHRLIDDPDVRSSAPLLPISAAEIGHPAIRNRGTLGGSLIHADPSAELVCAMVALDSEFRLRSKRGDRRVRARDFFLGPLTTRIESDEVLIEASVPLRPHGEGAAFLELAPRYGDFAMASVAALVMTREGVLTQATVAWSGAGPVPVLVENLSADLAGQRLASGAIEQACNEAARDTSPTADIHGDAPFKQRVLAVLSSRAVRAAATASA